MFMNTSSKTCWICTLAFLVSACSDGSGDPTLNHYQEEMARSVDALQTSLDSHRKEVLAETDLGRIRAMEQRHMDAIGMEMDRMLDANEGIGLCTEGMTGDAVGSLHTAQGMMGMAVDGASTEAQRHSRAMDDADDLDAALTEEREHQTTMRQILDSMHAQDQELETAMHDMQNAHMSMMCPTSSHMHRMYESRMHTARKYPGVNANRLHPEQVRDPFYGMPVFNGTPIAVKRI
jgi:transcriptional regulator with PAS, ATPase and Fis domain